MKTIHIIIKEKALERIAADSAAPIAPEEALYLPDRRVVIRYYDGSSGIYRSLSSFLRDMWLKRSDVEFGRKEHFDKKKADKLEKWD